ncbi:MAG TPA: hypothetical protein VJ385_01010 [Fibrobacteria bacterium]|nr:hypothetical protein [Fibrobacteria bacterium]
MRILVANPGSSSRRYALFQEGIALASAHLKTIADGFRASLEMPGAGQPFAISAEVFRNGPSLFLDSLARAGLLPDLSGIDGIAMRIVAPGTCFQKHAPLDEAYLEELEAAAGFAPLHAGPMLEEVRVLRRLLPAAPLLAISDSAFHASLPPAAREYALPREDADRFDIHRFGYHGISAQSILRKLAEKPPLPRRLVLCHLGSGASIMAVHDGRSVDASMGFSPLEGLVMGTRTGDLDPIAALHLKKKAGLDDAGLEKYLNTGCGLLGLSGITADAYRLEEAESRGEVRAALALEAFVHRARKYVAAAAAVLGGVDRIVFTAGIGERSPRIRARICRGLEWMGLELDAERNAGSVAVDAELQATGSPVAIATMVTREMEEMALRAGELLKGRCR